MNKHVHIRILVSALLVMAAGMFAGCTGAEQSSTDEHAAENRAFMAQVNQKVSDIDVVLDDFQAAVGTKDVVAMKASAARASAIVAQVKAAKATDKLSPVKDGYVSGLEQLQRALEQYTQLYTDLSAGSIDEAGYAERLRQVQETYDAAIAALNSADEQAVAVANE